MNRRGYTLMEMLIVLACMTVMFVFTSQLLLRLFGIVRETRAQTQVAASISRLTVQFREDVHAAVKVETDENCRLQMANGTEVSYVLQDEQLHRMETLNGKNVYRESYHLPKNPAVDFSMTNNPANATFVELNLLGAPMVTVAEPDFRRPLLTIRASQGRVIPAMKSGQEDES